MAFSRDRSRRIFRCHGCYIKPAPEHKEDALIAKSMVAEW
jgi:hypothetical protein